MAPRKPERILIVDDEADIAAILKLHLEDSGYITAWAGNGQAALQMLNDGAYSLAIMDVKMPGISGVEALKQIREAGLDVAVIMMTAHGSEDLVVECMKSGAVDYVCKPFSLDDMLQRVKRAVANRQMVLRKNRLEREKEDFFFMLSHDLKNPITAVIGSIDIMREGRLGPVNVEQAEYLQSAIESCNEIVAMIDNLLDVQRFEAGRMPVVIRPYRPAEIAAAAVERFSKAAEYEGVELSLETDGDTTEVAVDRNLMARVVANLLVNAIKFTPAGGNIKLSCRCVRSTKAHRIRIPVYCVPPAGFANLQCFVCISVSDSGNGIPHEHLDHIFERYTQSHNAIGRERGGAGLGLAFCKMAVESFNGIIWAESEAGLGSEFIILLPCYPGTSRCEKFPSEEQS
ncbi:MAG: response regulator [Geobacteraceae bacterium]|nr:response regulator [Geobacteraceae bacterium]